MMYRMLDWKDFIEGIRSRVKILLDMDKKMIFISFIDLLFMN